MGYRWKPSAAQKAAYRERCLAIEEAKSTIVEDGYDINCTGDCCTGDEIKFFNPAKASKQLYGVIVSESYGQLKQQHTFTVVVDGEKQQIKGRNLYKNGVLRKKWADETERQKIIDEKHERGAVARRQKEYRKNTVREEQESSEWWRITGDDISDRAVARMQGWL